MTVPETYDYLMRARRDLWAVLEGLSDELLSRPLAGEAWFPCLKDLVFHIITVEDGWLHLDILRSDPILIRYPALNDAWQGERGVVCGVVLAALLEYWQAVEQDTLAYLATLSSDELSRVTTPHDDPTQHYTVSGLLWHVMIHEIRHTAQIAVLLRMHGIRPPSLDLLFYL